MTLQQLRYVVTIAEIGTISKAAEELFVSQPSLTKALKELEADGLIIRKDYGEIPPRIEYSLSDRGKTLEPVLDAFCLWSRIT